MRAAEDLEGWAGLCPECLGKADGNEFLRMRLRAALRDRAAAAAPATATAAEPSAPGSPAAEGASPVAPGDWEDWYLRRGGFSRGPIHDGPWSMELEQVTGWLDESVSGGVIVELGAGMGWWTALLAEKGELWLYDTDAAALDAARTRLMVHGLLAHLHERDPLATPDTSVDTVFAAYLLGAAGVTAALPVVRAGSSRAARSCSWRPRVAPRRGRSPVPGVPCSRWHRTSCGRPSCRPGSPRSSSTSRSARSSSAVP